ncbi:MAG: cytochrome c oxidase subunit 3 [Opitutaceae bacterium]|jgi:cytochrome o ubiquinol oxidase subunit 3|nr:cytochrome c oxidase subunit 3 [Opitutaceae bacterium]
MSAHAGTIDHHHDHTTTTGIPNKKLFMWAFLASDCMFFGALISTHVIYRLHPTPDGADPLKIFSLELTSFSTFILLMSSLLMALAVGACQKGKVEATRKMILGTIFFGLIFLGCQVYEFTHFVHLGLTLNSDMFGATFYTLTGTHGVHVAIGVLWLVFMYIRTFKPADVSKAWVGRACLQFAAFAVATVTIMIIMLAVTHVGNEQGYTLAAIGAGLQHSLISCIAFVASCATLIALGRSSWAVDFGEANAVDVEGMGLYWHFVDIVWIVIFTVVYLLEYL